MGSKKGEFSEEDKVRCLLWSARHCCLCGKPCGLNIEIAHIPGEEDSNDIRSAIPLCFDCHGTIGHYDPKHPKGLKVRAEELRKRRDQVYEQHTRHLVPPVLAEFVRHIEGLPHVGFILTNHGNFPPVKAKVKVRAFVGDKLIEEIDDKHGYYSGDTEWHLNPATKIIGNFVIASKVVKKANTHRLRMQANVTLIDVYGREHQLLPFCSTYVPESKDENGNIIAPYWFLEPTSLENLSRRAKERGHSL